MKEFKKWWHKVSVDELNKSGLATAGWKAALEWAQSIDKTVTEEYQDSSYGAIKQSIAIDVELRGD